ncbi:outer membrane protein assembly factor BamA [Sphingomicrobium sp. XHP0235]|uniref:outer membrane protein assembly factor BamA n=1 Tax=Sphingomicrobium aquimarinum TaxID=3133971 RepID=UPI0031FF2631
MTVTHKKAFGRSHAALLVGTILSGAMMPVAAQAQVEEVPLPDLVVDTSAQDVAQPVSTQTANPREGLIRSIRVTGTQRIERETVLAYSGLQPGQTYDAATLDRALRALYDTQLFSDVVITGADTGNLIVAVQENPIINRIVIEGNRRLKDDKITPEIRLAPRQIFTRDKARADVDRIIELYTREGRYAAVVEPKIVQLDQNRVDLVFEITEGPKSKIRSINIIGNEQFSDGKVIKEMYSREAGGFLGFLKSNTSYDADRLAADQQKLRLFYLTEGYAEMRVVSALAELTPDREDFVITYVIEEGPRYKFGSIEADSALRDLPEELMLRQIDIESGEWFDTTRVEDMATRLNELAGLLGYAFANVEPAFYRDDETRTMDITFRTNDARRVYIDRVEINGNVTTRDNVIRREFRLFEGDPFNAQQIARTQDRIRSLGYFQEGLEIKQEQVADDRVKLVLDVEDKPTGQLSFSAGFSSLESFLLAASIAETNFRGKGQTLNAGVNWSRYSQSVQLGFTEPYFLGRPILFGANLYRQDYSNFNFIGGERRTTYNQVRTGGGVRLGFPITEYLSMGTRYTLSLDDITLDKSQFYSDLDGDGVIGDDECDPLRAGTYLCSEIGERLTSAVGYTLAFDNTNGLRATRGQRFSFIQDFAGLGGDVKYLSTRVNGTKYFGLPRDFVFSLNAQGGYTLPLEDSDIIGRDPIRITDRFFGPSFRGFDIRGIGPRVLRIPYDQDGNLLPENARESNSLGGRAYYFGRAELEIPVSASLRGFGIRPSIFADIGSVWDLTEPLTSDILFTCTPGADSDLPQRIVRPGDTVGDGAGGQIPVTSCADFGDGDDAYIFRSGYRETFVGNSPSPRLTVGVGANWNSPFGPLRIDLATAILKQEGDEPKTFSFNVGTQF